MTENVKKKSFVQKTKAIVGLLLNHLDAWGSTFIIAILALLLHEALNRQTILLAAAITAGYWLAFALNDYFDAPYDAVDPGKARRNFFVSHAVSRRSIHLLTLAFCLGIAPVFARFGWPGIVIALISIFVTWAYSAPPLRLKNRPGLDLLTHGLFVETYPYFVCLTLTGSTWTPLDRVLLAILFLTSLTAQLEQQLRDFEVDARTGRTFATAVGRRTTARLLQLTTGLLLVISAVYVLNGTIPLFVAAFGLIGLPAMLHRFLRQRTRPRSEKLVTLSAITGLLYTGLLLVVFALRALRS